MSEQPIEPTERALPAEPSPRRLANAIRVLTMDAVERAKSGHVGMPMGMADVAVALFGTSLVFDPDAPARQIKIPLPTNVSMSDMRRFKKGVSFMISEPMQRKINLITGKEKNLLKDDPGLGSESSGGFAFICSFSIEIIFIVAFFLLLIFVIILNFVFWWIMFFRICLPVPKKLLGGA